MSRTARFYTGLALCSLLAAPLDAGTGAARFVKQAQPPEKNPVATPTEPLRTASDRKVDIRNIRLDLRVDVEKKTVVSQASIAFQTKLPTQTLNLDAVGFEVKKVLVTGNGKNATEAQFTHDGKKLAIDLGSKWKSGEAGSVTVEYLVKNPRSGLHFFGPTKTSPETPLQVWSQGQTVTNRFWVPCIDEPNVRQTTQLVVTVPAGFEAISNGKLMSRKENPDKSVTFDWVQSIPHSSYLITLVVGQFDYVEESWNGIPVFFYVPKGRKAEAIPTYGKTCEMMTYFSSRFGIPYPWDKYAQISAYQFGGGMENTSATTMGDGILKDQRSLLDSNSESIVSHELAHQWWGDMVTCRDWSHTWLNEGFASYAEALWDEHSRGADEYALNMYQKAAPAIPGGKRRPIMDRRYTNPDSMFDSRVYPKGAWVLHMLRNRLGDDAFFKSLKQYGTDFKFQSAETSDFRRSVERTTGRDLERFFYDWLERPGNPDLEVTTTYNPETRKVHVVAKQTQTGEPFHFPLKVVLYGAAGSEPIILDEEMKDKELDLNVTLATPLQRVEVDPQQAVLTNLKETKSRELWQAQLLQGTTVPQRLRAIQHFQTSKEAADRELLVTAFKQEKFHACKVRLANAIGEAKESAAKEALLQGLNDADARVRNICLVNLGKLKGDENVTEAIRGILQKGDASYNVEGTAIRLYAKLGKKDALLLIQPYLSKPSHRDTLAISALTAISELEDPAVLDSLITWTEPGHARNCRSTAQRALVQLVKSKKLSDAQKQQVLKTFITALSSDDQIHHFSVLGALPELGSISSEAIPAVEKLVETAPAGNLQDTAKSTLKKIRKDPKGDAEKK